MTGAVIAIQTFGDFLGFNPHCHILLTDGCFYGDKRIFRVAPPLELKKLEASIQIEAPKEKIWDVLLQDQTYRIWTSVFSPNSFAETDGWKAGSTVYFKDGAGNNGMISQISEHRPTECIVFAHQGMLRDGQEIFDGPEVADWKGSTEAYYLTPSGNGHQLRIEQYLTEQHLDWFQNAWKQALEKIKELSES